MWLRLRQIALVARDLDPVLDDVRAVLGLEVGYRDPRIGDARPAQRRHPGRRAVPRDRRPIREGTTAERYLERRGGDGGYMVITPVRRPRAPPGPRRGARHPHRRPVRRATASPTCSSTRPTPAARSSRSTSRRAATTPDGRVEPGRAGLAAGAVRTDGGPRRSRAAEIQCEDPDKVAARWSRDRRDPDRGPRRRDDPARWRTRRCASSRSPTDGARASAASTSPSSTAITLRAARHRPRRPRRRRRPRRHRRSSACTSA